MKTLEKTFVMNADKCGNHTFTQLRREGNVCLYRRNRCSNGSVHSFEIFITKVVKAGSPLPGGGTVQEDYEQYPGASAFGRTALSTSSEIGANRLFEEMVQKQAILLAQAAAEPEETELVPVVRVSAPKGERRKLKWPEGPFTQKQLAAHNDIANYKEVYTDLQRALADGTLKLSEEVHEANRGRAAKMFELTVAGKAAVKA